MDLDYSLTVEDCFYFRDAIGYVWAEGVVKTYKDGSKRETLVHNHSIKAILEKTDGGWDWQDIQRWDRKPERQDVVAKRITKKLNVPEMKVVKAIARTEKKMQRSCREYSASILSLARKKGVWWVRNTMTVKDVEEEIRREKNVRRP